MIKMEKEISKGNKIEMIRNILSFIPDPEIPAISIVDLGVLRSVEEKDGKILISITPTYSGCPALMVMEECIKEALLQNNIGN